MVSVLAPDASQSYTAANEAKVDLLASVLRNQFNTALARGFHGLVTVELTIQDGTIQHLTHRLERTEK